MPMSSSTRRVFANLMPEIAPLSSLEQRSITFVGLDRGNELGVETTTIVQRRLVIGVGVAMAKEEQLLLEQIQDDQPDDFTHVHS